MTRTFWRFVTRIKTPQRASMRRGLCGFTLIPGQIRRDIEGLPPLQNHGAHSIHVVTFSDGEKVTLISFAACDESATE